MSELKMYFDARGILAFVCTGLIMALGGSAVGLYNALLPSIVDAWGVSKTVLAPLLMLNTGGAFAFGLLGGKVLKNVKAKTCMLIGSICCGLFLVGIGYIQSYVPFVLLGLLAGFSTGLGTMVPGGIIAQDYFGRYNGRVFGLLLSVMFFINSFITSAAANMLKSGMGYQEICIIWGIIIGIGGSVLALVIRKPSEKVQKAVEEMKNTKLDDAKALKNAAVGGLTLKEAIRTPSLWLLAAGMCATAVIVAAMNSYGTSFMTSYGLTNADAASYLAIYKFWMGVHALWSGFFAAKFGCKKFLWFVYSGILVGIALLYFWSFGQSAIILTAAMIMLAFVKPIGALPPIAIPEIFGRKDYDGINSIENGFYYGGTFISSLTTAMILDFLGGSACIIYLVILCVAACIFTTLATVMSPLVKQRKALEKAAAEQEPSAELS